MKEEDHYIHPWVKRSWLADEGVLAERSQNPSDQIPVDYFNKLPPGSITEHPLEYAKMAAIVDSDKITALDPTTLTEQARLLFLTLGKYKEVFACKSTGYLLHVQSVPAHIPQESEYLLQVTTLQQSISAYCNIFQGLTLGETQGLQCEPWSKGFLLAQRLSELIRDKDETRRGIGMFIDRLLAAALSNYFRAHPKLKAWWVSNFYSLTSGMIDALMASIPKELHGMVSVFDTALIERFADVLTHQDIHLKFLNELYVNQRRSGEELTQGAAFSSRVVFAGVERVNLLCLADLCPRFKAEEDGYAILEDYTRFFQDPGMKRFMPLLRPLSLRVLQGQEAPPDPREVFCRMFLIYTDKALEVYGLLSDDDKLYVREIERL